MAESFDLEKLPGVSRRFDYGIDGDHGLCRVVGFDVGGTLVVFGKRGLQGSPGVREGEAGKWVLVDSPDGVSLSHLVAAIADRAEVAT